MAIHSDYDLYLFHEGTHAYCYRMLGTHFTREEGVSGVRFTVWAPNAAQVNVVGDFNHWDGRHHPMLKITAAGVWSLFIPGLVTGALYKYELVTQSGLRCLKADPYAFWAEEPPNTASRVASLEGYTWGDAQWCQERTSRNLYEGPMLIYEVHLGSWRRNEQGEVLTYRELAEQLPAYVADMGYTHIQLLPIAEHPFDGSWGYQVTGYFAPTSRYGIPHDFMYFVDCCHQQGIGVILDWVPGHFCKDAHGLAHFDGPNLYEHGDPGRAEHPEWGTCLFDYGRDEVRSFLISNAVFWFDVYHIDGLRADAVSSMLYYDHGRQPWQWQPNRRGGRENLEAIAFIQQLNQTVFTHFPQAIMIAEESTDFSGVSHPVHQGGLGFNFKWNMGWMNDTLRYMAIDPLFRSYHHTQLTFSMMYAFSENFILPLSHDEVVHGKRSLLHKMPGDEWRKFAGLRALYGYMIGHPGKKLLFMGGEFGQFVEWQFCFSLDWHLLGYEMHAGIFRYVRDLNRLYRKEAALWELDYTWDGFTWIEPHQADQSLLVFARKARQTGELLVVVCNFTPQVHQGYRIGLPQPGSYEEVLNSDAVLYGGSGQGNPITLVAEPTPWQNQPFSGAITIPPLATVFFKLQQAMVSE